MLFPPSSCNNLVSLALSSASSRRRGNVSFVWWTGFLSSNSTSNARRVPRSWCLLPGTPRSTLCPSTRSDGTKPSACAGILTKLLLVVALGSNLFTGAQSGGVYNGNADRDSARGRSHDRTSGRGRDRSRSRSPPRPPSSSSPRSRVVHVTMKGRPFTAADYRDFYEAGATVHCPPEFTNQLLLQFPDEKTATKQHHRLRDKGLFVLYHKKPFPEPANVPPEFQRSVVLAQPQFQAFQQSQLPHAQQAQPAQYPVPVHPLAASQYYPAPQYYMQMPPSSFPASNTVGYPPPPYPVHQQPPSAPNSNNSASHSHSPGPYSINRPGVQQYGRDESNGNSNNSHDFSASRIPLSIISLKASHERAF